MSLLGDYLKSLRESRGISQTDAAVLIGISRQRLWDIENGLRYTNRIPKGVIEQFSIVYGVPIGVIRESAKVKIRDNKTMSEHLAETGPLIRRAVSLTSAMVNESRAYTPELEQAAIALFDVVSELKTKLDTAYRSLYPSTPQTPEPSEEESP